MNTATKVNAKQKIRCPECSNYVEIKHHQNGGYGGNCPVCKATFFCKQHSPKVRLIRIIKH